MPKLSPWLVTVLVGVAGVLYGLHAAERQGQLAERLRLADSTHRADSIAQRAAHDTAMQAVAEVMRRRADARQEATRDARHELAHDSTIRAVTSARTRAESVLLDSTQVLDSVRSALADMVRTSRADSVAGAAERAQHASTVLAFQSALASDSAALDKLKDAEAKAITRATSAERTIKVMRDAQPGFFARHLNVSVGYGMSEKGLGPIVAAGWRVF